MTRLRTGRLAQEFARGLAMVLLGVWRPASAGLDVRPVLPMIEASAGSTVVVDALIVNPTGNVLYLGSISTDIVEGFAAADAFDDYEATHPDSLLPGESWEGPVLRLTIAPDAPVDEVRQVTLHFAGGLHRYDEQALAEFTFSLNDTTTVLAAPTSGAAIGKLMVRASPNPTRGPARIAFELLSEQEVEVRIYDVRGAAIRSLARGRLSAGPRSVTWDGRDDTGAKAAPGLYLVRVTGTDGLRMTKVVLTR